jgi:hypothetical protein
VRPTPGPRVISPERVSAALLRRDATRVEARTLGGPPKGRAVGSAGPRELESAVASERRLEARGLVSRREPHNGGWTVRDPDESLGDLSGP